jgi:rubrerythrin
MNPNLHQRLLAVVRTGGAAYVRNLAAAERAIYQGQFNVAKVLRATGHGQRVLAQQAARLLQPHIDAVELLTLALGELDDEDDTRWAGVEPANAAEIQKFLDHAGKVRSRLKRFVTRSIQSLADHPDILERDVAMVLWGCVSCGNVVDGDKPSRCDLCGAPGIEFLWFGPFYLITPEHLGPLQPAEILTIVRSTPAALAAAVSGVDYATLERRPTKDEWSCKEILAHFIATDEFLLHVFSEIFSSSEPMPLFTHPNVPWKAHEGKGYETLPADQVLAKLNQMRGRVLDRLDNLDFADWSRIGSSPGTVASILDWGRWLANHDLGHLAQVRRLVGREETG